MIGIPQEKNARPEEPIGNAAIGFIQENGSPARNIPARPHLVPGIMQAMPEITKRLEAAGRAALRGKSANVDQYLNQAGIAGVNSVKAYIRTNIPPPLKPATVRARMTGRTRRRREARKRGMTVAGLAREEIALGELGAAGGVIALIDTADYINSLTWVVRTTG
jgi:hypothetical protein